MGSQSQSAVEAMVRPQPPCTACWCLSRHLFLFFFCFFSVVVMLLFVLFGNVYTGGVGAIVCWWRLEIHNRVPGECHCRSLPQLAIVRPGASNWEGVILYVAGSACGNTTACSWQRQRGAGILGPQPHFCLFPLSCHTHLGPFCVGYVLFIPAPWWKGKRSANQFWASVSPSLKWASRWEPDKIDSKFPSRVPIPLWSQVLSGAWFWLLFSGASLGKKMGG